MRFVLLALLAIGCGPKNPSGKMDLGGGMHPGMDLASESVDLAGADLASLPQPDLSTGDLAMVMGHMAAPGTIGAACTTDTDCTQTNASCILPNTNSKWPDGYCTIKNCMTIACPQNTFCQVGQDGLGVATCFWECMSDADCRTGYQCCPATTPPGTGNKVCVSKGVLC